MHRKIFYFLLFLVLCPVLINAGTKGRIKGKVVDLQTGEALIGANVIVVGTTAGSNTDANGEFLIQNMEAGVYEIKASYVGYQSITVSNIRVSADLTTYKDIQLPSRDIEVGTVTITSQRPLIQKDNTNAVRTTTNEDITSLPIRNVTNIIGLTAGVIVKDKNIYIRGGRSDEVGYYLEGLSTRNPMNNLNAVKPSADALEEIQVQSGGYTAEFGGSNAGIIRQQLKSGGSQFKASLEVNTDNIGFKGKDNAFDGKKTLGAYTWGNNETSGVISGPITDKLKMFLNVNYQYQRDPNPGVKPGVNIGQVGDFKNKDTLDNFVYPAGPEWGNQLQAYTYTGTLNYDLRPILLRLTGSYSDQTQDIGGSAVNGGVTNYMNTRLGQNDQTNGQFTLKMTHVISQNIYYEITAGYYLRTTEQYDKALEDNYWSYGDSTANAAAGWTIPRAPQDVRDYLNNPNAFGNNVPARRLALYNWSFSQNGALTTNYSKSDQAALSLGGNLSMLLGKYNSFKVGGEYQRYTLRNWSGGGTHSNLARTLDSYIASNTANKSIDELKADILRNNGVNNFGYDVFGNSYDGDGFDAPRKPTFASAYIQDKIEFEDIIINLGLRYDYIDIDNLVLKDPSFPDPAVVPGTTTLNMDAFEKTKSFTSFSPRLGFSFPVTNSSMFHAQYGKFVQQPQLNTAAEGYYAFMQRIISGGNYYQTVTGPDIRPTTTVQYEIGFTQQLTDNISFDITGFYRDIKDQVEYIRQEVRTGSLYGPAYFILGNGDYATTKGFEIALNMRRYERLQLNASLSFQDARGTGSTPNAKSGAVFQPLDGSTIFTPKNISPLINTKPLFGNVALDYRWGNNDGGPILQNLGVSALITFNTGHPYTKGTGGFLAETDRRDRNPVEALNASLTPGQFQVDLRVDKTFRFGEKLGLNVYLAVTNLFDTENVDNVFLKTGTANDDGVLSDPKLSAQLLQTYGQVYADMYKAIQVDYQQGYGGDGVLYGPPRQFRLGIRLEY